MKKKKKSKCSQGGEKEIGGGGGKNIVSLRVFKKKCKCTRGERTKGNEFHFGCKYFERGEEKKRIVEETQKKNWGEKNGDKILKHPRKSQWIV